MEELKASYEKLLRNVRAEERKTYEQELKEVKEANRLLTQENESLKKQLMNVYGCLYSSRNGIIGEDPESEIETSFKRSFTGGH